MRTVKQLPLGIPKDIGVNFPDGTILNETPSVLGTPVVREIYGDVLTNIYSILRSVGFVPNGIEDSEENGYQLLDALQKLCNIQNDIEQTLTLISTTYSINLEIDLLPDKYIMIARAVGGYTVGGGYSFKGSGALTYPFSSPTGFNDGDELLLVLDQTAVRAFSISGTTIAAQSLLLPVSGVPLAYNDSNKLWYQSEGILFSDTPDMFDLQSKIRVTSGISTLVAYEMICVGTHIICMAFDTATLLYRLYDFDTNNFAISPQLISDPFGDGMTDYQPFMFYDGTYLYLTNNAGSSSTDGFISINTIDFLSEEIINAGSVMLSGYQKTTNTVVVNNYLYTLIAGSIMQYNLGTGEQKAGIVLPGNIGVIFLYKGIVYFTSGASAIKWSLPVYV